jgi:hypothetical protein
VCSIVACASATTMTAVLDTVKLCRLSRTAERAPGFTQTDPGFPDRGNASRPDSLYRTMKRSLALPLEPIGRGNVILRTMVVAAAAMRTLLGSAGFGQRPGGGASATRARADSLFIGGKYQEAAQTYTALLGDDPSNEVAWYRLGLSLERLGKWREAIDAFEHVTSSPIQQANAEVGLARAWTQLGNGDSAITHLRKAAGYGVDPALIDRIPALAPLRSRPDYVVVRREAEEKRYPCRNVHTFDFWAGDFDAFVGLSGTGTPAGQLHNTREYEGCVLIERWVPGALGGPAGMSLSYYDPADKLWHFVWNDDSNGPIQFVGNYRDGAMEFEGSTLNADGSKLLARNVLRAVGPDTVRHTFSSSLDSGRTWVIQTDQYFVRRKP